MNQSLFSIIIPHYNIPDLLMRCLKSIPVTEDIQVIVVDDNSPDAETYLDKYPELSRPYLEFIRTTAGGGAGYARNVGLEHAKGKWLLFADADDLYVDGMYDIICQKADSDADVVFFKFRSVTSNSQNEFSPRNNYIDKYIATGDERFVRLRSPEPWSKMFRRCFVESHGFGFEELQFANDQFFSLNTGCYARKIAVVDTVLYVHIRRKESLAGTFCSKPGELRVRAEVSFRAQKMFKELNIDIDQQRPFRYYLLKMLKKDRTLFQYYWRQVDEIYPSKYVAFQILSKDKSVKFKLKLFLYSMWVWFVPLSHFKRR